MNCCLLAFFPYDFGQEIVLGKSINRIDLKKLPPIAQMQPFLKFSLAGIAFILEYCLYFKKDKLSIVFLKLFILLKLEGR